MSKMMTSRDAIAIGAYAMPRDNPQTPQDLAAEIQATLAEFQEKNDQRLAQLEQGREDAVTRDEVENLNNRLSELNSTLTDQARQVARLGVGGGGGGPDGDAINAAARFYSIANRRRVRPGIDNVDVDAYRAYRVGFEALVRQEGMVDHLAPDVRASLSIGSDRDGGYLVPTEMSSEMERRMYESSPMRQVARVITIGTSAWEAPFKASKGVSGGWIGERQSRAATGTGTVGLQRIEVHEQYAYPEVTQNMLDDGALDVEQFLIEDTEDEMSRTENTAFVSGDGVMKPKGFLTYKTGATTTDDATRDWGKLQYVPAGGAGAFPKFSGTSADDASALITLISKLHPSYRPGAAWAMNRQTEAAVRKLRDADGRYLVGFGDIQDGVLGFSLHNFPIVNMEDMPDIGSDSFSIAFGNWRRGYYIVDRQGFRVLRDPYTNKPYVGFYITKRVGGDVRNFDAIKLMKFATS